MITDRDEYITENLENLRPGYSEQEALEQLPMFNQEPDQRFLMAASLVFMSVGQIPENVNLLAHFRSSKEVVSFMRKHLPMNWIHRIYFRWYFRKVR